MFSAKDLTRESLETASEYLPALYQGLSTCLDYLDGRDPGHAIVILGKAMDGLEWLGAVLNGMVTWPVQESISVAQGEEWLMTYRRILPELLSGVENRDGLLLRDILHYDLLPLIGEFYNLLTGKKITEVRPHGA